MAGRKHTRAKKGGCCGSGGGRRTHKKNHRGGSVAADALVTVGALAAWKYLGKKKGGRRSLPTRKHAKPVAR